MEVASDGDVTADGLHASSWVGDRLASKRVVQLVGLLAPDGSNDVVIIGEVPARDADAVTRACSFPSVELCAVGQQ
jgi:hypothetical protein